MKTVLTYCPSVPYTPCVAGSTFNVPFNLSAITSSPSVEKECHVALYFSVAALLIVLALNLRSAHGSRADTLYHLITFEVCPQSSTNGRVKSSEKEKSPTQKPAFGIRSGRRYCLTTTITCAICSHLRRRCNDDPQHAQETLFSTLQLSLHISSTTGNLKLRHRIPDALHCRCPRLRKRCSRRSVADGTNFSHILKTAYSTIADPFFEHSASTAFFCQGVYFGILMF
ncbi:hypothetical protein EV421DRAFT_591305 [Armillaria borealis]|uniref:Uncharacterized protein n=1 Tax=Armillaria borealis TaxID=47425 RepID=A0AA39M643_9AGAR|nr:hypothetical protein EV421DRAFT_591305 [Armillaria borealis]